KARSLNSTLSMKISDAGQSATVVEHVVVDRVTGVTDVTTSGPSVASFHLMSQDHVMYAAVPAAARAQNGGTPVASATFQTDAALDQLRDKTGSQMLQLLAGANGSVKQIGTKDVDGVGTTGYTVTVNATALVGGMIQQIEPNVTSDQLNSFGFDHLPM